MAKPQFHRRGGSRLVVPSRPVIPVCARADDRCATSICQASTPGLGKSIAVRYFCRSVLATEESKLEARYGVLLLRAAM
jgi:hypothetical protein